MPRNHLLDIVFGLSLVFAAPAWGAMELVNGGFEADGVRGWGFFSRTKEGSIVPATDAHAGQGAARVRHDGERDWAFSNETRIVVKPNQLLIARGWVKGSGKTELAIVAYGQGKLITWNIGSDAASASAQWRELVAEAVVPEDCDEVRVRLTGTGKADLLVDDVTIAVGQVTTRPAKPLVQGFATERVRDRIGRGVVVMSASTGGIYVGWRLLETDPKDVAFNVYRREGQAAPVKLNAEPLTKTTDFVDAKAPTGNAEYFVRAVVAGQEGEPSQSATASAATTGPYVSIKLDGNHTFQKLGVADLDGDGRYDYVIKQPNDNIDPYVKYWKKSPGTYKLEAYRHDGTFLWRYDMGWSIEQGIWYAPYLVYDLDGDGRAEVAVKAGEGDPRDADGKVTSGPEYLAILDGQTGKVKARIAWPSREDYPDYNYYCRNQIGLAYLDGKTPCLIVERGTYNTIKVVAYQYHGGKLQQLWAWNDKESGPGYRAQGAHCLRAADIDGDGRDEVIIGSAVLDDNGMGLWTTREGHPDHVTIGDLDPSHPGLEIQYGIEPAHKKNAICMVDARTGKRLWGLDEPTKHVHSSGLCADLDPAHDGVECYGGERDDKAQRWLFSATGKLLAKKDLGGLAPRAAYWDADLQRELIGRSGPQKLDGKVVGPKFEGSIIAVVDLLGDWREEIVTSVAGELRIYSTNIPAADRRVTLIQDPIYRIDVATQTQAYYQIPGLSVLPSGK